VGSIAVSRDEYFCADLDWLFYMKYDGTSNNVCVQQVCFMCQFGSPFLLQGCTTMLMYRTVSSSILMMNWMLQQGFCEEND
jgi:hypothetical protein